MKRGLIVVAAVLILAVLVAAAKDRSGLGSRQQSERVLQRLKVTWDKPGPPVVVIFGPGCGDCAVLQDLLNGESLQYELVDVAHTPGARDVLAEISKTRLGLPREPATPTTIVGTKVIYGPNAGAVIEAIKAQHDW